MKNTHKAFLKKWNAIDENNIIMELPLFVAEKIGGTTTHFRLPIGEEKSRNPATNKRLQILAHEKLGYETKVIYHLKQEDMNPELKGKRKSTVQPELIKALSRKLKWSNNPSDDDVSHFLFMYMHIFIGEAVKEKINATALDSTFNNGKSQHIVVYKTAA